MTASVWDDFAARITGRVVKVDGIEYKLLVRPSLFRVGGYATEVEGIPTPNGKRTKKYQEERRKLGDDWSATWQELPPEILALFEGPK